MKTRMLLGFALVIAVGFSVAVEASVITAFPGDLYNTYAPFPDWGTYTQMGRNWNTDTVIRLRIDMGAPTWSDTCMTVNTGAASNWAMRQVGVYVAPDENAAGFDPANPSHYSVAVQTGAFPWDVTANLQREMPITPVTKRYYCVSVFANGYGTISGTTWNGTTSTISFNELTMVPEPATMILLGMGSMLLIRRKRA